MSESESTKSNAVGIQEILELLPHRYPFLLIDRVLDFEPMSHLTALKNVTINEPCFQGHFPGLPIFPGVLMLEALAQAGGVLVKKSDPGSSNKIPYFTGIDKVRFRRRVVPGDTLILKVFNVKRKMDFWKMDAIALVEEDVAVEGTLSAFLARQQGE